MQLQTQSIENDKQRAENDKQRAENRVSAVLKCIKALFELNPRWESDELVLQLQEVLTTGILHDFPGILHDFRRAGQHDEYVSE